VRIVCVCVCVCCVCVCVLCVLCVLCVCVCVCANWLRVRGQATPCTHFFSVDRLVNRVCLCGGRLPRGRSPRIFLKRPRRSVEPGVNQLWPVIHDVRCVSRRPLIAPDECSLSCQMPVSCVAGWLGGWVGRGARSQESRIHPITAAILHEQRCHGRDGPVGGV
jgi:hypothetical protein